ncbi:MAG: hypothetical protein QOJ66_1167 [Ilumatobacteraceae bacterium]|jgi:hypothetical protein
MSSSGGNTPARATNRSSTAWVIDGGNTPNFGFNATSTGGKAKGNLVFIRRTTYRGTKAILIVKSNAIDSLRSSGSLFPVTAMLSGKASYKIISLAVSTGDLTACDLRVPDPQSPALALSSWRSSVVV